MAGIARERLLEVLRTRAITIVYQPIYSLSTGSLEIVEALARFAPAPQRTPERWFAEAHRAGLGVELELAAIRAALDGAGELPRTVPLALNVSPAVLVRGEFAATLRSAPERALVVELTEHAEVRDYRDLLAAVTTLRERGVRLAVDDTGAGFASMRHVVRLVPEIIKLDGSLAEGIDSDPVRQALAQSLVGFAERIGATVVAEGVERPAQLRTLGSLGVHLAQGFLLGRPGPLPVEPSTRHLPGPPVPPAAREHDPTDPAGPVRYIDLRPTGRPPAPDGRGSTIGRWSGRRR